MNYTEAIEYLNQLRSFGARPGLEHTRNLAAAWGNPHENLRFIHVAGTNGKGSTCAYLESIYRHSGQKVGLYTSPHLIRFSERIQVNRSEISEADVARLVTDFKPLADQQPQETTFFEAVTIIALKYFSEQNCDLIIWETGLGGRLDATNIVTPLLSIITSIDFDHEKWLGNTLGQIAFEKAGIIKPGVPVLCGDLPEEALTVVRQTAEANNSPLTVVQPTGDTYLARNAEIAAAAARLLGVEKIAIEQPVVWPGRLHLIQRGSQQILLDGAHNPSGARALVEAFRKSYPGKSVPVVLGMFADKNVQEFCQIIQPLASEVILTKSQSERSLAPEELQKHFSIPTSATQNLQAALDAVKDKPFVLITGSLYLIGEALELLGQQSPSADEKQLNDWTGNASLSKTKP